MLAVHSVIHRVLDHELEDILNDFFLNFNVDSISHRFYIKNKYKALVKDGDMYLISLLNRNEVCATSVICLRDMRFDQATQRVSYCTQIFVNPKYRSQGYLNILMQQIEIYEKELNINYSIVIARHQVGSLYTKYNYAGFGIFPKIQLVENSIKPEASLNYIKNLNKGNQTSLIVESYNLTYSKMYGSLSRNSTMWQAILKSLRGKNFNLDYGYIKGSFFYFFHKESSIFEIGCNSNLIWKEILDFAKTKGITEIKVGSNHSIFNSAMLNGWQYLIRPEPTKGHMYKSYLPLEKDKIAQINTANIQQQKFDPNKYSLDIPYFDQW